MTNKLSITGWIFLTFVFLSINLNITYADEQLINWRHPIYIHDPSYQVDMFVPRQDGFEISIQNSKRKTFWHIQIISDDIFELEDGKRYSIEFETLSNKTFKLYSRLGEENVNDGNSYVDHYWEIKGDDNWHMYRLDFFGKNIANFLYFQPGKAQAGTRLIVRNIRIYPSEK